MPLYWRNLGAAHRINARTFEVGTRARGEETGFAIKAFERAHELEPINLKDFLEIAECHLANFDFSLAVGWAERAIGSDIDTTLEALIFICQTHIHATDIGKLEDAANRINTLKPDDEYFRKYAADRLATLANTLCLTAKEINNYDLYKPAAILLRYAYKLDPDDKDLREFHAFVTPLADALDVSGRFKDDSSISNGFRRLGIYYIADVAGEDIEDREAIFRDIVEEIDNLSKQKILNDIRTIKNKYFSIYYFSEKFLLRIEEELTKEEKAEQERRQRQKRAEEEKLKRQQQETAAQRQRNEQAARERQRTKDEEETRRYQERLRIERMQEEKAQERIKWWQRNWKKYALACLLFVILAAGIIPQVINKVKIEREKQRLALRQQQIENEAREKAQRAADRREKEINAKNLLKSFRFIPIKGGCFQMGDTNGDGSDVEKPVHEVCVSDFNIGKFEVTNGQYRKFRPNHHSGSKAEFNNDNQPVVDVSWNDAVAFAAWLSQMTNKTFRLPTEAEWEYAARGGTTSRNYWGNRLNDTCRYANVADQTVKRKFGESEEGRYFNCYDGYLVTAPVGSYKPNSFGLHDMIGNVSEMTGDWYSESYYLSSVNSQDPTGPAQGSKRVIRGGSWAGSPGACRSSDRSDIAPYDSGIDTGFRLVF